MNRFLMCAAALAALGFTYVYAQNSSAPPKENPPPAKDNYKPALVAGEATAKGQAAKQLDKPGTPLPVSNVVLFSSGVGYFQREGEIEGNARIDLSFNTTDINDLLKSLILQDSDGRIGTVSYDSQDPVEKTLRSYAINLTTNPTFGQLLNQARGEKVEVVMNAMPTQPGTMTGVIIGVEHQRQVVNKEAIDFELVNLMCADGLRSVPLNQVQRIRFLNPTVDSELRRALEVLALSHDTQKKAVSISFQGSRKRDVKVGYVVETPIWKTSYRLVIDKKGKPFLQGWAVVENTTDEDWNNVQLSLVSGRPISFKMDMYQPLYVPRPTVELELFASLRPVAYGGGMGGPAPALAMPAAPPPANGFLADREKMDKLAAFSLQRQSGAEYAERGRLLADEAKKANLGVMDLKQGVASVATAGEMGAFFQYVIDQKVTLPRQKSAMLPIFNQEVEGLKLSIYNQGILAKHPLHGLQFHNTSGQHLMQGPITVFENGGYAGDARIQDLQPNEKRLLSYAIDLGTEVEPVVERKPEELTAIRVVKGIIHATKKVREVKAYNIKNRSEHDRIVLIEHPYRAEFTLVKNDKLDLFERARDVYRFKVNVPAGTKDAVKCEVAEELSRVDQISINNTDDQSIRLLINSPVSNAQVKEVVEKAIRLKTTLAETRQQIANLDRDLKLLHDDQARLRANIQTTPASSEAYKRYVAKFDKQETEIEHIQDETKKMRKLEDTQRREFDGYLMSIDTTK